MFLLSETKATVRECFAVNKNTEYGCSTDQNALNDQKTILEKKFVNALKTLGVKFGDIQNREFCIKNDGTNKSGTLMSSSTNYVNAGTNYCIKTIF